jgi:hypothetical protein
MALIQLFSFAPTERWFMAVDGDISMPYNFPKYNNYCFLGGEIDAKIDNVIQHRPDIQLPFNVKKEKAASRIQKAWHNAINNPSFELCRKRLLCEFFSLIDQ